MRQRKEQVILSRCPLEAPLGQAICDDFLSARSWIDSDQLFAVHAVACVVISRALGHPAEVLRAFGYYFSGSGLGHLGDAFRLAADLVGTVAGDEVFAIR